MSQTISFVRRIGAPAIVGAILAGCGETGSEVTRKLRPEATPYCEKAFAQPLPATQPAPGSLSPPAITLKQDDYSQLTKEQRFPHPDAISIWLAYIEEPPIPPRRTEASSAGAVKTVVCVRETAVLIGLYQPSNRAAVRYDWDVRVLRWPGGEVMGGTVLQGGAPPPEIHKYEGDVDIYKMTSGSKPDDAAQAWLEPLFAQ